MADYTIYAIAESDLTISGGGQLDGVTQGDGSHLDGLTITFDAANWVAVDISDNGSDTNFADSDGNQRLDGAQTIFGTSYANNRVVEAEYTLTVEDPDGNEYTLIGFNINEPGQSPAYGTVEGLAAIGTFPPVGVALTVTNTAEGPPNSGGNAQDATDYAVPCFTPGTLVRTRGGAVAVEMLTPGTEVWTLDNGWQPVRLVLSTKVPEGDLARRPALRPVVIEPGALGPGRPSRRMVVSPQHRILIDDWRAAMFFGTDQVLVAAKHLVNGHGIRVDPRPGGVTYIHLVFERHEVIEADGVLTESFLPGPETLAALPLPARDEFLSLFPQYAQPKPDWSPGARLTLRRFEAALLAA